MLIKNTLKIFTCAMLISSCGGNQIELDVVLSVNQTENALLQVSDAMQIGASRGIFFTFDELEAVPTSVDDTKAGGDTFSDPSISGSATGFDPLQKEFKISTSELLPGSFYRIKMVALDIDGNVTHTGTGDCPVKVSLKSENVVRVCFGINDLTDPPLCPGLTNFTDCSGI